MQLLEQGGVKYIHRLTWDERAYICSLFKSIKTYDYVYIQPTDIGVDILAIKAKSIITRYSLPDIVPGVMCIQLTPFNSISEKTISDDTEGIKAYKHFPLNPDFILPSLDDCLSKYLYICQDPKQYALDPENNYLIYAMSYHIVNKMLNGYGSMNLYRQNSEHIIVPDDTVQQFISVYKGLRADDGANLINIHNRIITIYAGLLPLNKADSLQIHIYDNPLDNKFLIQYIVLKKKQPPIEINVFYIKV